MLPFPESVISKSSYSESYASDSGKITLLLTYNAPLSLIYKLNSRLMPSNNSFNDQMQEAFINCACANFQMPPLSSYLYSRRLLAESIFFFFFFFFCFFLSLRFVLLPLILFPFLFRLFLYLFFFIIILLSFSLWHQTKTLLQVRLRLRVNLDFDYAFSLIAFISVK